MEQQLSSLAERIAWLRRLDRIGVRDLDAIVRSPEEMMSDWVAAVGVRMRAVLLDTDSFSRYDESSLDHMALAWLDNVKECNGYHIWRSHWGAHDLWSSEAQKTDYYLKGCAQVHEWLVTDKYKQDHRTQFKVARGYIKSRFLDQARINPGKPNVVALVHRKARRMKERTGSSDERSLKSAQAYVESFYNNIIPAIEGEIGHYLEKVLNALRNDFGTGRQSVLVNVFEAALAIHFLDAAAICSVEKNGGPVF